MRERLLSWLAISERPDPPPGPGPTETFRASRGFFRYSVLAWIPKQIAALAGLAFSLAFFGSIDQPYVQAAGWQRFMAALARLQFGFLGIDVDPRALFLFLEALAVVAFVGQFLFTGLLLKLTWELRWYMVGERAIRIREGLWFLREQTMTIANIQTMIVRQGPVQRLFGFSDLEIHTAGGGAGSAADSGESGEKKSSLHVGRLRGLSDAAGLRDRIEEQLRRHTGAGLGDDDEGPYGADVWVDAAETEAVANDLLAEVRALRLLSTGDFGRGSARV